MFSSVDTPVVHIDPGFVCIYLAKRSVNTPDQLPVTVIALGSFHALQRGNRSGSASTHTLFTVDCWPETRGEILCA